MAEVIAAQIQNRRGLRQDLPQPLAPGEIGLCTDTGQVFIGMDPEDPASITAPTVEIYRDLVINDRTGAHTHDEYIDHANSIIDDFVLQVNLTTTNVLPNVEQNPDDPTGPVMYTSVDDNGDVDRAFIAYYTAPGDLPTFPEASSTEWVGTTNTFVGKQMAMDTGTYFVYDAFAVTKAINRVNEEPANAIPGTQSGLVTVVQNVEILTETNNKHESFLPVIQRTLTPNLPPPQTTSITYDINDANFFVIEYSLEDVETSLYSRIGHMTISTLGIDATVSDVSNSIQQNNLHTILLSFSATITGSTLTLEYTYTYSGLPAPSVPDLTFSTNTVKWKNF